MLSVSLCLFVCLFLLASAASHGCTAACWLIVPPALDVPTLATICPPRLPTRYALQRRKLELMDRRIITGKFCLNADFHGTFRNLLHAATWYPRLYFPSEGRRDEDFSALKTRRPRPGLNPRTWVPEASTLDHRSRLSVSLTRNTD
jgi:hypothetical protein